MDIKKYTKMNKEAWDEVHVYHQKGRKIDLAEAVKIMELTAEVMA